ncbi:MAG: DUF938 domain-containing protein [Oligoflexales bacterium]
MAIIRTYSEAADRNKVPIGNAIESYLKDYKSVLEIASGTLQHACYFAARFSHLDWTPSDMDDVIVSRFEHLEQKSKNINKPLVLDALSDNWPTLHVDALICINMIHIAPWEASLGLMRNGVNCLKKGGVLITYGPYFGIASEEAPSNIAFDQSLRTRNFNWGIRDLSAVIGAASITGLEHEATIAMPANNHVLVFRLVD